MIPPAYVALRAGKTLAVGSNFLKSIPGLHKRLQIPVMRLSKTESQQALLEGHEGGVGLGGEAGVDERGLPVLPHSAPEQEGVRFHQQALRDAICIYIYFYV